MNRERDTHISRETRELKRDTCSKIRRNGWRDWNEQDDLTRATNESLPPSSLSASLSASLSVCDLHCLCRSLSTCLPASLSICFLVCNSFSLRLSVLLSFLPEAIPFMLWTFCVYIRIHHRWLYIAVDSHPGTGQHKEFKAPITVSWSTPIMRRGGERIWEDMRG